MRGLFKRKGRFTTVEGETYTWKRPGLLSGRRIFCKADGTEVMHIDQTLGFSCTRANIMMLPADIPERDRVLLAGLAMHMVTIEQMMIVLFAALMPLFLTAAS